MFNWVYIASRIELFERMAPIQYKAVVLPV